MKSRTTSKAKIETYMKNIQSGNIRTKAMRILDYIRRNPFSDTDAIRSNLQISHQTTTGVISNFMDLGIIKIVGTLKIKNNVYSKYVIVTDYQEQTALAQQRLEEKYQIWLKQGKTMYHLVISTELLTGIENELEQYER
jgi:hypothetical protein